MRAYYDPDACRALAADESDMRKLLLILMIVSSLTAASGCVYRASISQGNLIKQEDLDQAEVGIHRHGLDAAGLEPAYHLVQIGCQTAEAADRLGGAR